VVAEGPEVRFGWNSLRIWPFPQAAKPAPIEPFPPEEERFLESSKPTLEVEQALTNRPANPEAVPAASETVIETIVVTEPEPVANPAPVRLPAPVPASALIRLALLRST